MKCNLYRVSGFGILVTVALLASTPAGTAHGFSELSRINEVLEWNQIFIDTLIASSTANSSSQRLGAIVHTAIFDAYNGIERRYQPILVRPAAGPGGAPRGAGVGAAA